jgi:hypothetical protein
MKNGHFFSTFCEKSVPFYPKPKNFFAFSQHFTRKVSPFTKNLKTFFHFLNIFRKNVPFYPKPKNFRGVFSTFSNRPQHFSEKTSPFTQNFKNCEKVVKNVEKKFQKKYFLDRKEQKRPKCISEKINFKKDGKKGKNVFRLK